MPLTITQTKLGGGAYRITYTGTSPYKIYQGGRLLVETEAEEWTVYAADATSEPDVVVLDAESTDTPEMLLYSPWPRIQWRGRIGASYYEVRDSTGTTTLHGVNEDGRGYYAYSAAKTAAGAASYRIYAFDAEGNSLGYITAALTVVCNPEPPSYTHAVVNGACTMTGVA